MAEVVEHTSHAIEIIQTQVIQTFKQYLDSSKISQRILLPEKLAAYSQRALEIVYPAISILNHIQVSDSQHNKAIHRIVPHLEAMVSVLEAINHEAPAHISAGFVNMILVKSRNYFVNETAKTLTGDFHKQLEQEIDHMLQRPLYLSLLREILEAAISDSSHSSHLPIIESWLARTNTELSSMKANERDKFCPAFQVLKVVQEEYPLIQSIAGILRKVRTGIIPGRSDVRLYTGATSTRNTLISTYNALKIVNHELSAVVTKINLELFYLAKHIPIILQSIFGSSETESYFVHTRRFQRIEAECFRTPDGQLHLARANDRNYIVVLSFAMVSLNNSGTNLELNIDGWPIIYPRYELHSVDRRGTPSNEPVGVLLSGQYKPVLVRKAVSPTKTHYV